MVWHWPLAGLLALAGCAGGGLSGIPQEPGAAHPALQALAQRADGGDKQAQLALGILYEQERFLGQDLDRAENLYERAAKPSGGTIYVYQPPVGKGAGQVVPVNMGPRVEGLAEAARRLERLKRRRKLCVECI